MTKKNENISEECHYTVYIHIFPNQKKYVGITGQRTKDRWRVNGNGYKPQKLVYRAIKKYGWENIEHIIVAENLSVTKAGELEKKLSINIRHLILILGITKVQEEKIVRLV